MTRIILTLLLIMFSFLNSFSQEKHSITIELINFKSDKGKVFIALYNKKDQFLKKPFKTETATISSNKALVVFKDILAGEYTVSAFHDENDNKKMDTKMFGIPKEPIGISNNAKGFFGPPKYEDAKFIVNKNINLKIKMY